MTLYVVQAAGSDVAALEKARFVKQGFSWPAFVFAQLWLLYNRLWLPLAVWVALEVGYFLFVAKHVPPATSVLIDLLAHLYIGFEGNSLRLKRKAALQEIIEARDRDEAETIFYRRHLPDAAGPAA